MERLAGINGIIITDSCGHYLFRPTDEMESPLSNHHFFFRALTENSLVLYGRHAWEQLGKQIPPADSAKILVGLEVHEALAAFPYNKMLVVGNRTVLRSINMIHNIVLIEYKHQIPDKNLVSPLSIELPHGKERKVLCETPFFTICDLTINSDSHDSQEINSSLSSA